MLVEKGAPYQIGLAGRQRHRPGPGARGVYPSDPRRSPTLFELAYAAVTSSLAPTCPTQLPIDRGASLEPPGTPIHRGASLEPPWTPDPPGAQVLQLPEPPIDRGADRFAP